MLTLLEEDLNENPTFFIKKIPNKKDEYEVTIFDKNKKKNREFSISSMRTISNNEKMNEVEKNKLESLVNTF